MLTRLDDKLEDKLPAEVQAIRHFYFSQEGKEEGSNDKHNWKDS